MKNSKTLVEMFRLLWYVDFLNVFELHNKLKDKDKFIQNFLY